MYFEDLKRGPNAEIGPKDIFEIASSYCQGNTREPMVIPRHLKLLVSLLLIVGLNLSSVSCGIKGPPRAPQREEPPAVTDLHHRIENQQVVLTWSVPSKENRRQDDLAGFTVYRSKVTLAEADCKNCPIQFKAIGNVPLMKKDRSESILFSDILESGYRYIYLVRGYGKRQMISADSNLIKFVY